MRGLDFVSSDLGEAEAFLAANHAKLERVCLCRVRTGYVAQDYVGEPTDVFGPGEVFLLSPPELPYSGRSEAAYDLVMFDTSLLDQVAGTDSTSPARVRLTGHRPVTEAAGRQLGAAMDYVHRLVDTVPDTPELLAATAAQHLAASVLNAFPTAPRPSAPQVSDRDGGPATLRRAIDYIDANAHADITLNDIASAVFVTPRALQYMFRRNRGCTPMEYLRSVRLAHAHAELAAGAAEHTSVSKVARTWGFGHPGRFARYYRETYGVAPATTLDS